jgi:3-phosphoshikimate 1-carboxyvinyltransferase
MNKIINPFKYNGSIKINSSKSIFQRALAISCFSKSEFTIVGDYNNEDTTTAIQICKKIGLDIKINKNELKVSGNISKNPENIEINSRESGLSTRMFSVLLSSFFSQTKINLEGTAKNRKFDFSSLERLGIKINNSQESILIDGKIKSGIIKLNNQNTSQLLSALLITMPFLNGDSEIICKNLVSKNYVDITLEMLKNLGINILNKSYERFIIKGNQKLKKNKIVVEGDWSSAAFHFVGAAISGKVDIYGLNINSSQGDKEIINVLRKCGSKIKINNSYISVLKDKLIPFVFDATDYPDLFPPLIVLASCCEGDSIINGVDRLINKESNRALSLKKEFSKLGVDINHENNSFRITGKDFLDANEVSSHLDHRIAMSLSIAAIKCKNPITINNSEVVNKSYSRFYDDLEKIAQFN